VHQDGESTYRGCGRLRPAEVFDAEAMGAFRDLQAALQASCSPDLEIVVCLGNIAAASCLRGEALGLLSGRLHRVPGLTAAHGATSVR
jgi:uracil-DNA glycosylase